MWGEQGGALRRTIFNLECASSEDRRAAALSLYVALTEGDQLLELNVETLLAAPVASWMGLRPFLAMPLIDVGEHEKAITVPSWPPPSLTEKGLAFPDAANAATFVSVLSTYCRHRIAGLADEEISRRLAEEFGPSRFGPVLHHLLSGDFGAFMSGRPASPLRYAGLAFPRCAHVYNCPSCPRRWFCYLDEWLRLSKHLRGLVHQPDPTRLLPPSRSSPNADGDWPFGDLTVLAAAVSRSTMRPARACIRRWTVSAN